VFNGILYVLTTRFPSPTPGGNRSTPSWRRGLSRPPHTSRCSNVVSSYLRCSRSLRSFLEDLRSSRTPVPQLAPSVLELLPRKRFAFSHAPGRSLTASQAPDIVRRTVPAVAPYGSRSSKTFGLLELLPLRGSRSSHLAPAVLELRSIGTSFLAALELLPRKRFAFPHAPVLETLRVSRTTSFQDVVLRTVAPFRGLPKRIPLSASPHNLFTGRLPA
jgi:hypothetical protein